MTRIHNSTYSALASEGCPFLTGEGFSRNGAWYTIGRNQDGTKRCAVAWLEEAKRWDVLDAADCIDSLLANRFDTAYTFLPLSGKQALIRDVQDMVTTECLGMNDAVRILAERIGWSQENRGVIVRYVSTLRN